MRKEELYITASLARLELDDNEAEILNQAVTRMLEYFSMMDLIDVDSLPPTTHAAVRVNRTRKDIPSGLSLADALIDRAPEKEAGFITIPNVL